MYGPKLDDDAYGRALDALAGLMASVRPSRAVLAGLQRPGGPPPSVRDLAGLDLFNAATEAAYSFTTKYASPQCLSVRRQLSGGALAVLRPDVRAWIDDHVTACLGCIVWNVFEGESWRWPKRRGRGRRTAQPGS